MPRVLMLCYYFPPIIASGTSRSLGFASHLPAFGWEPWILSVVNPKDPWVTSGASVPPNLHIERAPEYNLPGVADTLHGMSSRVARLFGKELKQNHWRKLLCNPDPQKLWLSTTKGRAMAESCDLIYVSCAPFSAALSGIKIKHACGKPLVVDFRDAWSLNPHVSYPPSQKTAIQGWEREVITHADHLILNTEGALKLYREQYPEHAAKLSWIPNGYDQLTPVASRNDSKLSFRIMHIGSFYGTRSPDLLLEAMSELKDIPLEFVQVGGDFASRESFDSRVKITVHPPLPREQALELMSKASLLYLKQGWEDGVSKYIAVAAKTYEYLATGLPILAEVPPGDNADILASYANSATIVTDSDKQKIKDAIARAYEQRAQASFSISGAFVEKFDRRNLTQELSLVFDSILSKTTHI